MRNPNSFGGSTDNETENSVESSRATKQARGNKVMGSRVELTKEQEMLLKEKDELEAGLRALGFDVDEFKAQIRAEFYASRQKLKPSIPEPKSPELVVKIPGFEDIPLNELSKNISQNTTKTPKAKTEKLPEKLPKKFPETPSIIVGKKAKKNQGLRNIIAGSIVGLVVMLGGTVFGGLSLQKNQKNIPKANPTATEFAIPDDQVASLDKHIPVIKTVERDTEYHAYIDEESDDITHTIKRGPEDPASNYIAIQEQEQPQEQIQSQQEQYQDQAQEQEQIQLQEQQTQEQEQTQSQQEQYQDQAQEQEQEQEQEQQSQEQFQEQEQPQEEQPQEEQEQSTASDLVQAPVIQTITANDETPAETVILSSTGSIDDESGEGNENWEDKEDGDDEDDDWDDEGWEDDEEDEYDEENEDDEDKEDEYEHEEIDEYEENDENNENNEAPPPPELTSEVASPSIADGLDMAIRTAFAEGAYDSEDAARSIADVIINRALNKGTSVGAEVAVDGQFTAYTDGVKGRGNWGWNNYGSGPSAGSIGTERVQQIFMEELNKATSGQPLAHGYTGFRASGDGRTNVYR